MAVVRTAMTLDRFSRVTIDQFSLDKDSHTSLQSPYSFRHNAERIATPRALLHRVHQECERAGQA